MQTQDAPKDNGKENASMYPPKLLGFTLGMLHYYAAVCYICFQEFIGGSNRNSMRDPLIKKSS